MFPQPDARGRFGIYGGRYVPETLIPALDELEGAYRSASADPVFQQRLNDVLHEYVGRPSRLSLAANLTARLGGARIWLKREDLNHTGAHKINNTIGQVLLAKRMNKTRIIAETGAGQHGVIIAETGAGQHGVATATAAALFGLPCVVYMGEEDVRRQALNVFRMKLLGAEVRPVASGTRTLKDATNEAIRDWVTNVRTTFYVIGSVVGPHPYPMIVRDFQSVIGRETMDQLEERTGRRAPDAVVACVGGGSNAIGIFAPYAYLPDGERPRLIGVEAAGHGMDSGAGVEAAGHGMDSGAHAASISAGKRGVLHGALMYLLSDDDGQISPAHSVSAGLDYPGVGPEHSWYADAGRAEYVAVDDEAALRAFGMLAEIEGIIPALETSHALAYVADLAPELGPDADVVVNLSGRGDKDVNEAMRVLGALRGEAAS